MSAVPAVICSAHCSSNGPSDANPSGSATSFHVVVGYGVLGWASVSCAPASDRTSSARRNAVRTAGSTGAQPRSSETAIRSRGQSTSRSTVVRRSPTSTGQVRTSGAAGPAITDRASAASRTLRVSGPSTDRDGQPRNPGIFGTRPKVTAV